MMHFGVGTSDIDDAKFCSATTVIEDEICVETHRCELPPGHNGPHKTTYPGLDDWEPRPVTWTDDDRVQTRTRH